jgi:dipeptidase
MITYSADSHVLYGELYHWPASVYPDGSMLKIYEWDTGKFLGQIKQVKQTYNVIGNMNEHQVTIGETTYGGLDYLVDTTGIMDYGSLIYVTLQRAKTAREAIKIMTDLVREYGYYSSGESFSIADPNEVWILEMIGKGSPEQVKDKKGKVVKTIHNKGAVWVAMRIPDGYISGHANHARITTFPLNDPENCLYSPDVISFARDKKLFSGKDEEFSFSDTYGPIDFGGARFCEARVWAGFNRVSDGMDKYLDYAKGANLKNRMPLFVKPNRKLSVHDVMEMMRDYYQGTDLDMTKDVGAGPYKNIVRWRPMTWKVDGVSYFHERAISTQQTGFSFVAQMRSWLPDPIGGIFWFGLDDTYMTVYSPMYCSMKHAPKSMERGNGSMMVFSETAAFWVFNQVSNLAYTRFSDMGPEIRAKQAQLESDYMKQIQGIDKTALELYQKDPSSAADYLTTYSCMAGDYTTAEWKKLYYHLFTKYLDGNIKEVVPGQRDPKVKFPGYSPEYYKMIIESSGDKFKVLSPGGH